MEAYIVDKALHVFLEDGKLLDDKDYAAHSIVYKDAPFLNCNVSDKWDPTSGTDDPMGALNITRVWPIGSYRAVTDSVSSKVNMSIYNIDKNVPDNWEW